MADLNKNISLLVDIGNTSVKWCLSSSAGLTDMKQQHYPITTSSDFFVQVWQQLEKPRNIVVSCVGQDIVWQSLDKACHELWELNAEKISSSKTCLGVVSTYVDAVSLGSDRWAAMIGARGFVDSQKLNKAIIVIDVGSAITIDVVNVSGLHLGGYIVPGIATMRKSLGQHTAQVQTEANNKVLPSLSLADSTTDCVNAGIYLSAVKLIESVIKSEAEKTCFITGGDAKVIADLLSSKCVIIPNLVLRGIDIIARNNSYNN